MKKIHKIFEIGYLIVAIVFFVETVLMWNTDKSRALIMLIFGIVAVFMYFFKKKFRKKIENNQK
jgi:c-di-AMP phosphodiesterase-like protein